VVAANQAHLFAKEQAVTDKTGGLQRELDELQAQINTLERKLKEKPDYGLGQGDPAITQWELDRTLLQQLKTQAAGIERTLSQAAEKVYGICEQCGEPIHPDRLAVLPNTKICIRCAKASVSR
jgi:RNA polymerase-binding transcription factor DksA